MKTIKLFVMAFVLLVISQSAGAQVTTAQIREEIEKGECETAQSLYNVYKAMNGANKTIEREIADCKTDSSSGFGGTGTANGHEYVDLDLPSGTLWATCNVGASKPEDYGNYYAWGETKVKSVYNDETYKYCNVNWDNVFGLKAFGINNLTKYCNNSSYGNNGFTDNQTMLEGCDDVAKTNWGNGWHIPTKAQWNELLKYTTNQWTTQNGVSGTLFTAKNGQTLFLPAAGSREGNGFRDVGSHGKYWSSLVDTDVAYSAWYFSFVSGFCRMACLNRTYGFSVRPVREK